MIGDKIITTLASVSRPTKVTPQTIVYSKHISKRKEAIPDVSSDEEVGEITLEQARQDVFKFGLNALSRKERTDAKVALAIKLGAIPPKRKCIPLKELKEKRMKEKLAEEQMKQENDLKLIRRPQSNSNKGPKNGKKKPNKQNGQLKVGTFDGGMLKISSSQLKKLKAK